MKLKYQDVYKRQAYSRYEESRNACYKHIGHLDEGLRNTINSLGELQRNYLLSDYEITVKEDYEAFKGILDELDQLTVIIESNDFSYSVLICLLYTSRCV